MRERENTGIGIGDRVFAGRSVILKQVPVSMPDLKSVLNDAAVEGIISHEQADKLFAHMRFRGVVAGDVAAALPAGSPGDDLSRPRDGEAGNPLEDSETPRFIRGFHDVLITIGIVVALVGLWGIWSYFAALPAIILLAEILVRRQRLALPAVVLTLAYLQLIAVVMSTVVGSFGDDLPSVSTVLLFMAPFPILLAVFYWRYRVPLALSALFFSIACLLLAAVFFGLAKATGAVDVVTTYRTVSSMIFLVVASGVFAVAMRFDLADPRRLTRRSDVAFWLHLGAAPALLYAMLSFVFLDDMNGLSALGSGPGFGDAIAVVLIVALFMAIGLIIDRRAFVTSGLLSLGLAVYSIFKTIGMPLQGYFFGTLVLVGLVVLVVGVGWPIFRRAAFTLLPAPLKTRLPPLR